MPATIPLLQEGRYSVEQELPYLENCSLFQAYDTENDAPVTIVEVPLRLPKVATAAQREALHTSFVEQAEKLTGFKHKSIPGVLGYFTEAGRNYIVTDPLDGVDLASVLAEQKGPFSVEEVTSWADTLLDALNGLHTFRPPMVYRNISPVNIMLGVDRSVEFVPAGMVVCGERNNSAGGPASTVSSIAYSPLEQIWSGLDAASQKVIISKYDEASEKILKQELDARSDIYSLGATLYHLVTGKVPFDALERSIEMIDGNADPLQSPHTVDPSIPPEVSDVIMKAMEVKREYRFDSAAIMRQVLRTALVRVKEREDQQGVKPAEAANDTPTESAMPSPPSTRTSAEDQADVMQRLREAEEKRLEAERRAAEAEKKLREAEAAQVGRTAETANPAETDDDLLGLLSPSAHTSEPPQTKSESGLPRTSDETKTEQATAIYANEQQPADAASVESESPKAFEAKLSDETGTEATESDDLRDAELNGSMVGLVEDRKESMPPEPLFAAQEVAPASASAAAPTAFSGLASEEWSETNTSSSSPNLPAMAAAAVVLLLAAVGAWFYLGSKPDAPAATTATEMPATTETVQPDVQPRNQSQAVQPEPPAQAAPPSTDQPAAVEQDAQVQPQKAASTAPKAKKPAPAPTKAPAQKKAVTVDDLINDN